MFTKRKSIQLTTNLPFLCSHAFPRTGLAGPGVFMSFLPFEFECLVCVMNLLGCCGLMAERDQRLSDAGDALKQDLDPDGQ